jgi:hypothetical protein
MNDFKWQMAKSKRRMQNNLNFAPAWLDPWPFEIVLLVCALGGGLCRRGRAEPRQRLFRHNDPGDDVAEQSTSAEDD